MPKVKVGNEFQTIPWNPDVVAGLIYKGYTVHPDEGTDPATYAIQQQTLEPILRKLWGDKPVRAIAPGLSKPFAHQPFNSEEPPVGTMGTGSFDVMPNPYITKEPTVDLLKPADLPYDKFDLRKKPIKT
jgi:hypothetical protein